MSNPASPKSRRGSQAKYSLVSEVLSDFFPYILGFGTLFLAWHIAAVYLVSSVLFPPPAAVVKRAEVLIGNGSLVVNTAISLQRIAVGFVIGSALGIPIGLAMGSFETVRKFVEPWTEFLRFIPATGMITISVIWFGIGEESKAFLIIYTTIFIVIINTTAGVAAISRNKLRAAQVLGASRWQIFSLVAFPATVPFMLTGMRLAMANSFTTIVAAELVSAQAGLGVMLWNARLFMQVEDIFVSLFTLGILGFIADRIFRFSIYRFAGRYSPVT